MISLQNVVAGRGGDEKTKTPMLRKVKDKVKVPMKKIRHTIGKKSKNNGDKQGDDNLASTDNFPDPEEEEYEEDEQEFDPEVHGSFFLPSYLSCLEVLLTC